MTTFAYAGYYLDNLLSSLGTPLANLQVTVCIAGTTTHAVLYTDRTKAVVGPNPVFTDANSNLSFYADPGLYDIYTLASTTQFLRLAVVPDSGDLGGGGGGGAVTDVNGQTGSVDVFAAPISAATAASVAAAQAASQPVDPTLTALAGLSAGAGLVVETAADTFAKRSLAVGSSKVSITNADGAAGNPTIDVAPANFTGIPEAGVTNLVADLAAINSLIAANDTAALHKAGIETATGAKTFTALLTALASAVLTAEDPLTIQFVRVTFNSAGTNLWECRVNGNLTGYANEGGELRSRAYNGIRVSFRTQSNIAGDGTTVHIIEATLSDNTPMFYVNALGDSAFSRDVAIGRNLAVTTAITIGGIAVGVLASTTPTANSVTAAGAVGTGTTTARSDHQHAGEGFGAVSSSLTPGQAAATGTAATVAHSDHVHGTPVDWEIPNAFAGAWWGAPDIGASGTLTGLAASTAYLLCIVPTYNTTLAGIILDITAGDSTGTLRFGLASDVNGQPGLWLNDFGTASATAIAVVQPASTPSVALTAGTRYWVAIIPQGITAGLTVRNRSSNERHIPIVLSGTPGSLNVIRNGYLAAGSFSGALAIGGAVTPLAPGSCPAIAVKLT